ncbi:MAG: protein kinase, partial [Cellvibrio sp.]
MSDSKDGDKTTIKPTPPVDDARTKVAPRPVAPNQTRSGNPADDEKTRIAQPKPVGDEKTRLVPGKPEVGEKARIIPPKPDGDEKTRVASRTSEGGEKTRTTAHKPAPSQETAALEPTDKTRFVAPKKVTKQISSDATVITENPGAIDVNAAGYLDPEQNAYPVLKNRFVFEELLGSGGMGAVYKAKDLLKIEAQDREPYVAIKVLSDEFKSHPEAFMALQRESRKSQKIAHPNIVNVHDFDRDGDTVFMTMEYMQGKPLDKLISQYRGIGLPSE